MNFGGSAPLPDKPKDRENWYRWQYFFFHRYALAIATKYGDKPVEYETEQYLKSQPPPAPETGEWRLFEHYRNTHGERTRILDSAGVLVAEAQTEEQAAQIVSDHNAIQPLVAALEELLRSGVEFDDSRLHYVTMQVDREAIADTHAALALTTLRRSE